MPPRDLETRVIDLEIVLTHQQRDLAELSRQLIEQRKLIEALQRELGRREQELPKLPLDESGLDPRLRDSDGFGTSLDEGLRE